MSPPREVDEVCLQAIDLLEREGIPFVLMGGPAVNTPREHLPAFLAAADRAGFSFEESVARGFVDRVGQHPLVVIQRRVGVRSVHVDLFLAETPFLRRAFDRAVTLPIEGQLRRVVTAADLILMKLLAWRPKDRVDIQNVLVVNGIPEEGYLREQSAILGIGDRLEQCLSEWRSGGAP